MLALIFANIGYALTGLLVFAVYRCSQARTWESWATAIILCLLSIPAWLNTWYNPESLAIIHFGILCIALVSLYNGFLKPIAIPILLMLLADVLCNIHLSGMNKPLTYASLFWWQSALNVLFAYQCFFTILACGKSAKKNRNHGQGSKHDRFLAKKIHLNS